MIKLFIFLTILFCQQVSCQVKDSIQEITFEKDIDKNNFFIKPFKKTDTVYVYFEYKKSQKKGVSTKKGKVFSLSYTFFSKNNETICFSTGIEDFLSFKDKEQNKKADVKWVSKKFLNFRKQNLYNEQKICIEGYESFYNKIAYATIYLIDKKIKKKKKYKAREVNVMFDPVIL